ncbi:hypothetical protein AB4224_21885 [Vibrio lentus]
MSRLKKTSNDLLNGLFCVVSIFLLSFGMRMLLPFGSEPDFLHRIDEILYPETYSGFNFLHTLFSNYVWSPSCNIIAPINSFGNSISNFSCGETYDLKLLRYVIYISYVVMLLFVFALLRTINKVKGLDFLIEIERIKAVIIALLFPSMIYYLGVAALESITLFLSLLIYVFISRFAVVFLLMLIIFNIDPGSAIVVSGFVLLRNIVVEYNAKFKTKMIISLLICSLCFVVGIEMLTMLFSIPILGSIASVIYEHYTEIYTDVATKYPLILRPFVTFMTGVFMTSDGVKSIIALLLSFLAFCNLIYKSYLVNEFSGFGNKRSLELLAVVAFILSFSFVLPGYTNAKYYIFLLPAIMLSSINLFGLSKVILFNFAMSCLVLFTLLHARM